MESARSYRRRKFSNYIKLVFQLVARGPQRNSPVESTGNRRSLTIVSRVPHRLFVHLHESSAGGPTRIAGYNPANE